MTFTRCYGGRQQERDRDNLIGGMKTVVDAMLVELLLVDDTSQWAELHYQQLVTAPATRGLLVHLEELWASHCAIAAFGEIEGLRGLEGLRVVYFEGNPVARGDGYRGKVKMCLEGVVQIDATVVRR